MCESTLTNPLTFEGCRRNVCVCGVCVCAFTVSIAQRPLFLFYRIKRVIVNPSLRPTVMPDVSLVTVIVPFSRACISPIVQTVTTEEPGDVSYARIGLDEAV